MNPSRSPEKGEVLKLGPPASGEVVITVDPGSTGTAFAAGTQTLLPGAQMPVHKHLDRDTVWFVHKGQARATLNERVIVVVPGAMLYVPRGAWHGLRNTGTGTLQIAWVSAPPGLEVFFRDLSRAGVSPSTQALQELAQRHRVEFGQAADAPRQPSGRHRGRRGGHRNRGGGRQPSGGRHSLAGKDSSGSVGRSPSVLRHSLGSVEGAASVGLTRRVSALPSPTPPAAPAQQPSRPAAGRQRPPRGRHRRRVREVYMGGRWIQVEGEGPVIAPGSQRSERRGPKQGGDDEPPDVRLSVPL